MVQNFGFVRKEMTNIVIIEKNVIDVIAKRGKVAKVLVIICFSIEKYFN